jgi:hypothetical protein
MCSASAPTPLVKNQNNEYTFLRIITSILNNQSILVERVVQKGKINVSLKLQCKIIMSDTSWWVVSISNSGCKNAPASKKLLLLGVSHAPAGAGKPRTQNSFPAYEKTTLHGAYLGHAEQRAHATAALKLHLCCHHHHSRASAHQIR